MKVLIKQATIVHSSSPYNGLKKDFLINNGIIEAISDNLTEKADTIIQQPGLHVSIGWMDTFAHFCDPGFEYRETLETGSKAAAAGGFTDVMVIPNTNPVTHNKSQIEYIVQKAKSFPVNIHPIGAVTKNTEGKELTEMYDMQQSGAIAFSDGLNAVQSADILLKALQYILPFEGTILQIPDDKSIQPHGLMNEGIISTQIGLPGKPAFVEEVMIARDIEIVKYTKSKLHFTGVSTKNGIALISKAKAAGLKISCSVTPYHLLFCDEDLTSYDTNLKVNPPLRTKADQQELQLALQNGLIDCIASHHHPQNYDAKVCEFEYAKNGMIGLESLFGTISGLVNENFTLLKFVELLTIAPRKIFGLQLPEITVGAKAVLTLFNPTENFIFKDEHIHSKSANTAFKDKKMTGKVIGIINGYNTYFN